MSVNIPITLVTDLIDKVIARLEKEEVGSGRLEKIREYAENPDKHLSFSKIELSAFKLSPVREPDRTLIYLGIFIHGHGGTGECYVAVGKKDELLEKMRKEGFEWEVARALMLTIDAYQHSDDGPSEW